MNIQNKPTYAPNAVATSLGWMNPKTGELIVSVRGLDNAVNLHGQRPQDYTKIIAESLESNKKEKPPVVEKIVTETTEEVNNETSEKVEDVKPDKEKVTKSTTKKTTKKSTNAEK